ncbi:hypothetical protein SEEH3374_16320 [Salmonella enterica subsp. enterica serovar Heidelberg str. RI-11-013374]|nr:hypothetical protein SEEH3374_16320 [Salmonella enterica subsp. enterica serovar Heidelberg str. RI-11-013374]
MKNIGGGFQVGEIAGQVMLYIRKERIVFNIPFMPRQENCRLPISNAAAIPVMIQVSRIFRPEEESRVSIIPGVA